LHPRTHYAYGTSAGVMNDLREAFEFMTNTNTCVEALQEAEHYKRKQGCFSSELATKMSYDNNTSPGKHYSNVVVAMTSWTKIIELLFLAPQWCAMFGGDTLNLQKLALQIVSQCCSSSRCERNWCTLALIHTKVQNKLSYKKLHKLVYVNYNLHIRLRQAWTYQRDEDPFSKRMKLSLYDEKNLIRDWMENGKTLLPNKFIVYLHSCHFCI
jgi:hypothetical protein